MEEINLDLTCGVVGHDSECLCDVVVTEPAPIITDWVRDSWLGKKIVEYSGLSMPFSDADILTLLVTQMAVHDEMARREGIAELKRKAARRKQEARETLFTREQMEEVRNLLRSGLTTTQVRVHCKVKWDIDLKKSYASKIQARLREKATT